MGTMLIKLDEKEGKLKLVGCDTDKVNYCKNCFWNKPYRWAFDCDGKRDFIALTAIKEKLNGK